MHDAATRGLVRGGHALMIPPIPPSSSGIPDGATDGAQFTIEVERTDGSREVVWQRFINPLNTQVDRGTQRLDLVIPPQTARVILRTSQGPSGKGDWDWTYWTQLEFSL